MNTANLQLQGLIMAFACVSETLVEKGALTHQELAASLGSAERLVDQDDTREVSEAIKQRYCFPFVSCSSPTKRVSAVANSHSPTMPSWSAS